MPRECVLEFQVLWGETGGAFPSTCPFPTALAASGERVRGSRLRACLGAPILHRCLGAPQRAK